jgi:hypothetical protein
VYRAFFAFLLFILPSKRLKIGEKRAEKLKKIWFFAHAQYLEFVKHQLAETKVNRIEENTGNKFLAMSYIIFFYALQHSFIPLLFEWEYILFRFLSFLPLMIVLAIIYNKKRALTPLMIGHAFLDLATGIQILIFSVFPEIFEIMQQSVGK